MTAFFHIWRRARRSNPVWANTLLTAGTNFLIGALGMLSGVIAARLLGPSGRGELAAIQVLPSFMGGIAMLGLPEAVAYFSASEPQRSGSDLGSAMIFATICALPVMAIAYCAMPLLLHAQTAQIISAARWYLLIAVNYSVVGMLPHPMQGLGDFASWNAMRLAPQLAGLSALSLGWFLGRANPSFVAGANLAAVFLLLFPYGWLVRRRISGPFRPDLARLFRMLRYGLPCVMTLVPQVLNFRLDQILMAALLPPRQLGLYVVAVGWSGAAAPLLFACGHTLMPSVASVHRQQGISRFVHGTRVASLLALVLSAVLITLTPWSVAFLFGEYFRAAIPAALILVPAGCLLGLNFVLQEGLRGLGQPYSALKAELAGLGMTAVALVCLLRPFGLLGAAVASLMGYSVVTLVLLYHGRRFCSFSTRTLVLPEFAQLQVGLQRINAIVHEFMAPGN